MPTDDTCPRCGSRWPSDGPSGFCPRCSRGTGTDLSGGPAATLTLEGLRDPHHDDRARTSGVLLALHESIGPVPHVLLRDGPGEGPRPVRPRSEEMPDLAGEGGRYQLLGEIARGGMGVVLKGRDVDLGRDLAVKVLLEKHRDHPEMVRRFVEEAQIGGQLQHPGIVPVYELGQFPDLRLYIAMKLVGGRTLAALLESRKDPSDDRPRFLSAFEHVCQTMAYAHSRGVIHRDLKPSNVMVGSFGEVQVMDWGLAKVLGQGGIADEQRSRHLLDEEEAIKTLRSGSSAGDSRAGSIMGTPAYMAPEQARGALEAVDERADVFGLGSILCEILTGEPAYSGRSSVELYLKAQQADLVDAFARLEGCGADGELVSLAKSCLAASPKDRPRDAGVVAAAFTGHLAGVARRLREAELAQAGAEARVAEERHRRALTVGLAASGLALVLLGVGGWIWASREKAARAEATTLEVNKALDEADEFRDLAKAMTSGSEALWAEATEAARRAEALTARGEGGPDLRTRVQCLKDEIAAERTIAGAGAKDRRMVERLAEIHADYGVHTDRTRTDAEYAQAFADYGVDVALKPSQAAAPIATSPAAVGLAGGLDQWTFNRRRLDPPDLEGAAHLMAIAKQADPDPWRNRLRDALERETTDRDRALVDLKHLAESADVDRLPGASVERMAAALAELGDQETAVSLFRRAQQAHPDDFWINSNLGADLMREGKLDEAIRFFSIAVALRPGSGPALLNLGTALHLAGRLTEAATAIRKAARFRPDNPGNQVSLGAVLLDLGQPEAARNVFREAETSRPDDRAVRDDIADVLIGRGEWLAGAAELRESVRLDPDDPFARDHLGMALDLIGRGDEAIAALREAARLSPGFSPIRNNLGRALLARGELTEALQAFRLGLELGSLEPRRRSTSAEMVREAERLIALDARRPALLRGEDRPADPDEAAAFARLCLIRGHDATSARLWVEAFTARPSMLDDPRAGNRFQAARAAALASSGEGRDEPVPDEPGRARWRRQALDWLRADLEVLSRLPESGRLRDRSGIPARLGLWRIDRAFAGLRDEAALARLPEADRQACLSFWSGVEALAKKVRSTGKIGGPRNVSGRLLELLGGGDGDANRGRRGGLRPPLRGPGRPDDRGQGGPDDRRPPGGASGRRPRPPEEGPRDPFEPRKSPP